jgi:nucleoside-diphosphate kinase
MEMFHLDRPTAEEFYEVYKGVLPEFTQMVEHLSCGPCIVMEVRQENAVQSFR